MTSQRSGTVSLSRARYGVLAELYIVLSRFCRSEKCSMWLIFWRIWWMITRFSKIEVQLEQRLRGLNTHRKGKQIQR